MHANIPIYRSVPTKSAMLCISSPYSQLRSHDDTWRCFCAVLTPSKHVSDGGDRIPPAGHPLRGVPPLPPEHPRRPPLPPADARHLPGRLPLRDAADPRQRRLHALNVVLPLGHRDERRDPGRERAVLHHLAHPRRGHRVLPWPAVLREKSTARPAMSVSVRRVCGFCTASLVLRLLQRRGDAPVELVLPLL